MRRRVLASLAVALLSAATVGVTSSPASAGKRFTVTSPAFGEREPIPEGFTCAGAEASLPLKWTKPPKGTEQLALVMDDPDAGGGDVHVRALGRVGDRPDRAAAPGGDAPGRCRRGCQRHRSTRVPRAVPATG